MKSKFFVFSGLCFATFAITVFVGCAAKDSGSASSATPVAQGGDSPVASPIIVGNSPEIIAASNSFANVGWAPVDSWIQSLRPSLAAAQADLGPAAATADTKTWSGMNWKDADATFEWYKTVGVPLRLPEHSPSFGALKLTPRYLYSSHFSPALRTHMADDSTPPGFETPFVVFDLSTGKFHRLVAPKIREKDAQKYNQLGLSPQGTSAAIQTSICDDLGNNCSSHIVVWNPATGEVRRNYEIPPDFSNPKPLWLLNSRDETAIGKIMSVSLKASTALEFTDEDHLYTFGVYTVARDWWTAVGTSDAKPVETLAFLQPIDLTQETVKWRYSVKFSDSANRDPEKIDVSGPAIPLSPLRYIQGSNYSLKAQGQFLFLLSSERWDKTFLFPMLSKPKSKIGFNYDDIPKVSEVPYDIVTIQKLDIMGNTIETTGRLTRAIGDLLMSESPLFSLATLDFSNLPKLLPLQNEPREFQDPIWIGREDRFILNLGSNRSLIFGQNSSRLNLGKLEEAKGHWVSRGNREIINFISLNEKVTTPVWTNLVSVCYGASTGDQVCDRHLFNQQTGEAAYGDNFEEPKSRTKLHLELISSEPDKDPVHCFDHSTTCLINTTRKYQSKEVYPVGGTVGHLHIKEVDEQKCTQHGSSTICDEIKTISKELSHDSGAAYQRLSH